MKRIKANKIQYGGIAFDSQFEYNVFLELKRYIPIASIDVHYPLIIRPQTDWFKPQQWKIDFRVKPPTEVNEHSYLYVEVKGIIQADFKERIKNLSFFCPQVMRNLIVVTPISEIVVRGFSSVTPKILSNYLYQGKYSELTNMTKKVL